MSTTHAPRGALALAVLALGPSLLLAGGAQRANAAETVVAGYVYQSSPKPNYIYGGSYGAFFSSQLVNNGDPHTVINIDLYGLLSAAGFNAIESISISDAGNNQYGGSPGADLDFFNIVGAGQGPTVTYGYLGPNAQHSAEASATLGSRVAGLDAVSGDQDYNSLHFVSLGKLGVLTASFSSLTAGSGGSGGGSGGGGGGGEGGGSGPGEMGGGEPEPSTPTWNSYFLIEPGLKLQLSEAGSAEGYVIKINALSVPSPAAAPFLSLLAAGVRGRRRKA